MRYEQIRYQDIVLLCLLWAILGGMVWNIYLKPKPKIIRVATPILDYSKPKLIEYVYNHSLRIDLNTAKEIVDEVLKTDHPILMLSLMKVESSFNPSAVSKANAKGLGQIMYVKGLRECGINNPRQLFNISSNIQAMEYVFNRKLKRAHGNYLRAIQYYFGKRSQKYLNKVIEAYMELRGIV